MARLKVSSPPASKPATRSLTRASKEKRKTPAEPRTSPPTRAKTTSTEKQLDVSHKKRYRPGTKALKEIRRYQKGTGLLVPRAPFTRLVREVTAVFTADTSRFTAEALECVQTACEALVIQLFEDSVMVMINANRVTLMAKDMQLIRRIRGIY